MTTLHCSVPYQMEPINAALREWRHVIYARLRALILVQVANVHWVYRYMFVHVQPDPRMIMLFMIYYVPMIR
jgi:hypothetical protein